MKGDIFSVLGSAMCLFFSVLCIINGDNLIGGVWFVGCIWATAAYVYSRKIVELESELAEGSVS